MSNPPDLLHHRYQIIKALGEGGFGKTFLAEDTQLPSRRRCVIKQLKLPSSDSDIVQLVKDRFAREAAVLESVSKGNSQVPDLYAYFLADNQFYLVQEWIRGKPLIETVSSAWSEEQVVSFLKSVLPALSLVHQQNIIHRDIKPENIILRQSDQQPCLIDFGAVKEILSTIVAPITTHAASIVIGTPGFMAPEQASGRPTFSSDLYSLAMTAIFLLTARSPQEIPVDSHTGQILWPQYAPNITPHLTNVLTRAIDLNPQRRYPTAADMLAALNSSIPPTSKSTSVTATTSSLISPTSSHKTSSQSLISPLSVWKPATIVVIGSMLSIGAIAISRPLLRGLSPANVQDEVTSQSSSQKVQSKSTSAAAAIDLLTAEIEDAESRIAEIDKAEINSGNPKGVALMAQVARYEERANRLYQEGRDSLAIADIESALAINPDAIGPQVLKGDILVNQSRPDFEGAIALYTQVLNSSPKELESPEILLKRCSTYAQLKNWTQAEADCTRSIELDADNAKTYAQRADIFTAQNLLVPAEQDYTTAIELNDKGGVDDRSLFFRRAEVRGSLGNPRGALDDFDRVKSPD